MLLHGRHRTQCGAGRADQAGGIGQQMVADLDIAHQLLQAQQRRHVHHRFGIA
jgi:hypothetical protein